MKNFEQWWSEEGSAMRPMPAEDVEEFAKRIAMTAWSNGAYIFAKQPEQKAKRWCMKANGCKTECGNCPNFTQLNQQAEPVAWIAEVELSVFARTPKEKTTVEIWKKPVLDSDVAIYTTPPAAQPAYPLPDNLYESKDWQAGNYAERVAWLHGMYESKKQELEAYFDAHRPWVELTASTILNMMPESIPAEHDGALMEFARDIEAKLKGNT